jgi:hypothetical protein
MGHRSARHPGRTQTRGPASERTHRPLPRSVPDERTFFCGVGAYFGENNAPSPQGPASKVLAGLCVKGSRLVWISRRIDQPPRTQKPAGLKSPLSPCVRCAVTFVVRRALRRTGPRPALPPGDPSVWIVQNFPRDCLLCATHCGFLRGSLSVSLVPDG